MTVEKILCVGGVLLISGHESKAVDQVLPEKDEQITSQSFCEQTENCVIRSNEMSVRTENNFLPLEYPRISPALQIETLPHRQEQHAFFNRVIPKTPVRGEKFVPYRPVYRGEKSSLTPPSKPKVKASWSAPAQKWQGLNIHHHTRKFDRAYIRSKTRGEG